jgi:hypothetical protein
LTACTDLSSAGEPGDPGAGAQRSRRGQAAGGRDHRCADREHEGAPASVGRTVGRSEIRILLVFDPWRSVILLVAGDKSGQWDKWYQAAIPRAEQLYDDYLAERRKEMGT